MNLSFFVVFALLLSTHCAIPSKETVHNTHVYSAKSGFAGNGFIGEIKERAFGTYDGLNLDPKVEVVSDDIEQPYKDLTDDDDDDFHEFEDVVPDEVRFLGQSVETEDINEYSRDNGANESNKSNESIDDTGKNGSSRQFHNEYRENEGITEPEQFEDGFRTDEEHIKDITVQGLSDYSYLVEDKLHGLNEMNAAGATKGLDEHLLDFENQELFEAVDSGVGQGKKTSYRYREPYDEGDIEMEDMDHMSDEHDYRYNHMNKIKVKGQGVGYETDDGLDDEDYNEGDEAVRYEDELWSDDDETDGGDDYDEEIDHDIHSADLEEGDGYDDKDFDESDDEYSARPPASKKSSTRTRVKGMSVTEDYDGEEGGFDEEDEDLDEELADDMNGFDRQESDDDDYGDEDDYVDDVGRLEDDEEWDEDEDENDLDTGELDVDGTLVDVGETDLDHTSRDVSDTEAGSRIRNRK